MEILLLKSKIQDFSEMGHCEVNSLEEANLILKILSEKGEGFYMKYGNCPLGEYWYFSKKPTN